MLMKIKHFCISTAFFIFFLGSKIQCQSIAPQSINSSASSMNQSNGSLSFTLGELVILTQTDSQGNTLGGGFTSGATISTASIQEPDLNLLNVKVYPNPTTELITVDIQDTKLSPLIIEVSDANGKIVTSGNYTGIANKIGINSASWNNGIYFLNIKDGNDQLLGSFKIIKQ